MEDEEINSQLDGMKTLVRLSKKQTELSIKRTDMAIKRTKMSEARTDMNVERTYMNYERTLSVWVRTSLAVMVFGIAIDRLSVMLYQLPADQLSKNITFIQHPSTVIGIVLVGFSVLMALFSGLRFIYLARRYHNQGYSFLSKHKTWLPAVYAFMVALFGCIIIVLMAWIF